MVEVWVIFFEKKMIQIFIGKVEYDYLVLVVGIIFNFFGNEYIEEEVMFMKIVLEVMGLRNVLLVNFEWLIICSMECEWQELFNVVVVGGGVIGVEIVGVFLEMKKFVLFNDYLDMFSSLMYIYLIEVGDCFLVGMFEDLFCYVEQFLCEMGVNILLNKWVMDYKDYKVMLEDGIEIVICMFIWVSGVVVIIFGNIDGELLGCGRRIKVDEFNCVQGIDIIFVIGD